MRVIAGVHKGRKLKAVQGNKTRPTTDKIKEAIFQVMGPYFEGGASLDLFAGSGSLGIEALSRGMDTCIFVDKQLKAVQTIKENISQLKIEQIEVYRTDGFNALQALYKKEFSFDLILLDPPYEAINYDEYIKRILELHLIKEDGLLYCEHDPKLALLEYKSLEVVKHTEYSKTIAITIFKKRNLKY